VEREEDKVKLKLVIICLLFFAVASQAVAFNDNGNGNGHHHTIVIPGEPGPQGEPGTQGNPGIAGPQGAAGNPGTNATDESLATSVALDGALRLFDSKYLEGQLFSTYDARHGRLSMAGARVVLKLGRSYEEKMLERLEYDLLNLAGEIQRLKKQGGLRSVIEQPRR